MKIENLITKKKRLDRRTIISKQLKNYTATAMLAFLLTSTAWGYYYNTSPKPVKQTIVPEVVKVEAVEKKETENYVDRFFDIVRTNESSYGTNKNPVALHNYCKSKGKWNEIGYNPANKFCFGDMKEAKLFVAYYLKRNCSDKSLASCLCYWNTGKNVETCHYSEGNLSKAN